MSGKRVRFTALLLMSTACGVDQPLAPVSTVPPFEATNLIDFGILTPADPTTFSGSTYPGQESRTMFDRRVGWITVDAYLFDASFDDGLSIEIQVNPEFGTPAAAQVEADFYARSLGRLPTALRQDVETVWIHMGSEPFSGFDNSILIHAGAGSGYGGFLEETLAHEAAHVSLDPYYANASGWLAAQSSDPTFISTYARSFPMREDIAESFVAYLGIRYRADRLSEGMRASILAAIPNRIAFFDGLDLDMHPFE